MAKSRFLTWIVNSLSMNQPKPEAIPVEVEVDEVSPIIEIIDRRGAIKSISNAEDAAAVANSNTMRPALAGAFGGGWSSDHRQESLRNTNSSYIAIHALGMQFASAKVSVFDDGPNASQNKAARKSLRNQFGSFDRWQTMNKAYVDSEKHGRELPPNHELVKLLSQPNPFEPGAQFRYRCAQQIRLTGTTLIWNIPNNGGKIYERYVIPTAAATFFPATERYPRGYYRIQPTLTRYTPMYDQGFVTGAVPGWNMLIGAMVDAREIQRVSYPHALWLDDGQSPLSACSEWIDAETAVTVARTSQLQNGVDGSLIWILPENMRLNQDQMNRAQEMVQKKFGGPENNGKVLLANFGTTIEPIGITPKDMCYSEGFADTKAASLSVHNTPPVALGLQESGAYAAYYASLKAWRHASVQPLCDWFAEWDTLILCPLYGKGLSAEYESDSVHDEELKLSEDKVITGAAICTVDEVRARFGYDPIGGTEGKKIVGAPPPMQDQNGKPGDAANDHAEKPNKLPAPPSLPQPRPNASTLFAAAQGAKSADLKWRGVRKSYNPEESRNEGGEWTSGGGAAKVAAHANSILGQHGLPQVAHDGKGETITRHNGEEYTNEHHNKLTAAHGETERVNKIFDQHGIKDRAKVTADKLDGYQSTHDAESIENSHNESTEANELLKKYGLEPKAKLSKSKNGYESSIDPYHLKLSAEDVDEANKHLSEIPGAPQAKMVRKGGEYISSIEPDDAAEQVEQVKEINKKLMAAGLEPSVKLDFDRGMGLNASHDIDEIESALDTLAAFRKLKSTAPYPVEMVRILEPFGLKAWDESKHPRGKPENAGEFASSPGGSSSSSSEEKPSGGTSGNRLNGEESAEMLDKIRAGDERSKNGGELRKVNDAIPHVRTDFPLSELSKDDIDHLRSSTSADRVEKYSKQKIDTPVHITRSRRGKWVINDGGHRILAAIDRGDSTIPALVPEKDVSSLGNNAGSKDVSESTQQYQKFVRSKDGNVTPSTMNRALPGGEILVDVRDGNAESIRANWSHEVGHNIYDNLMTDEQRSEWREVNRQASEMPSSKKYSQRAAYGDPEEDFPEAFSAWTSGDEWQSGMLRQPIKDFLKKHFGNAEQIELPKQLQGNPQPDTSVERDKTGRRVRKSIDGEITKSWDESKHPRGKPENAGEFASSPGGSSTQTDSGSERESNESNSPKEPNTNPKPPHVQPAAETSGGVAFKQNVSAKDFLDARNKSSKSAFLSQIDESDLDGHSIILTHDGKAGAVVSPEGDIKNVFNNGGPGGVVQHVMIEAIRQGGKTLDCYAGFLPGYYSNFGFTETGRMKFDRNYAPDNWDYEKYGEPDIVFMARTKEDSADECRSKFAEWSKPEPKARTQPAASDRIYSGDEWDQAKSDSERIGSSAGLGDSARQANDGSGNSLRSGSTDGGRGRTVSDDNPSKPSDEPQESAADRQKRVDEWTSKFNKLVNKTGRDEWDVMEDVYKQSEGKTHAEQMAIMQKMIDDHGDKPREWEPEHPMSSTALESYKGESPEKFEQRKKYWNDFNQVRQLCANYLAANPDVATVRKTEYLKSVQDVMRFMPGGAVSALASNVEGFAFYGGLSPLQKFVDGKGVKRSGMVGGVWDGNTENPKGTMHLDGGFESMGGMDRTGIYSHEFGHACDWTEGGQQPMYQAVAEISRTDLRAALIDKLIKEKNLPESEAKERVDLLDNYDNKAFADTLGVDTSDLFRKVGTETVYPGPISDLPEWRAAYQVELSKGQLSNYGATHRAEGFAEFARLCWGSGQSVKNFRDSFPLCFAVFKKHGLV